jgi:hypothetical protein
MRIHKLREYSAVGLAAIALLVIPPYSIRSDARAQPTKPSPSPTGHVPLALPIQPPPGWNPQDWARVRQGCQTVADKAAAHQPFNNADSSNVGICRSLNFENLPGPGGSTPPSSKHSAMPIPTPAVSPQPGAFNPALSASPIIGPFGNPFTGGSGDACSNGQPPDVAADVSPTQIVQLMNFGLWVFDKTGQIQGGYPQTLPNFWFTL